MSSNILRDDFTKRLEALIESTLLHMEEAGLQDDMARFKEVAESHRQASLLWLQVAQGMSPEKAYAVLIGFATCGELAQWAERSSGARPPTVLSLYKK